MSTESEVKVEVVDELVFTSNNLLNVITWLRAGHIICLHNSYKSRTKQFYYLTETLESITNQQMIYINVVNWCGLLDEDEWPYYIEEEGFVPYKSINVLPKKEHHFELP
jgi:hypothetical protein